MGIARRKSIRAALTAMVLVGLITASHAAPITIFNTGVDDNNNLLPSGAVDLHYKFNGGSAFVVTNGVFPLDGNWLPDGPNSLWIGPSPSATGSVFTDTDYQLGVDLTGLDPSTVTISGFWSMDNEGTDILINGQSGFASGNVVNPPARDGFHAFHSFSITGGFINGINTIDFIVHNDEGPTGLRVDGITINGTSTPSNHYKLIVGAWIPFDEVADPLNPAALPKAFAFLVGIPLCDAATAILPGLGSIVEDTFQGDGHSGFDGGSYRVQQTLAFDWDGKKIQNFSGQAVWGPTHRLITQFPFPAQPDHRIHCVQTAAANSSANSQQLSDTTFLTNISTGNPLIPLDQAPPIVVAIAGDMKSDGSLHLVYQTTEFPSIGIRVERDGIILDTHIVSDAACLQPHRVLGPLGAKTLFTGLTRVDNFGNITIAPTMSGSNISAPSKLCR